MVKEYNSTIKDKIFHLVARWSQNEKIEMNKQLKKRLLTSLQILHRRDSVTYNYKEITLAIYFDFA